MQDTEHNNVTGAKIYGGYEQDGIIHDTAPPSMLMPTEVVHTDVSAEVREVHQNDILMKNEGVVEENNATQLMIRTLLLMRE